MPTPRTPTSPLILRPDGGFALAFDAASSPGMPPKKKVKPEGTTYTVVGYRQTLASAAAGGKANRNYFRFRNEGVRALARSFRGQPFIAGHDWGDPRSRGGTIADAWADQVDAELPELVMYFEVLVTEDWAIRGFETGTIDRFSIGADPAGEITCTVHEVPIWSVDECWCCPGSEVDGKIAEFEYEDAVGLELSPVNVPAVEGTYVLAAARAGDQEGLDAYVGDRIRTMRALGLKCGRSHPALARMPMLARLATGGAPVGGFRPARPAATMAAHEQHGGKAMDRALICQKLGLAVTATDEEIAARFNQLGTDAAQAGVLRAQLEQSAADREAELAAAHVESSVAALRTTHQVTDKVVASLRAAAAPPGGRVAFDAALALVLESAPKLPTSTTPAAAGVVRAALQSDAKPAPNPGNAALDDEDGPDAFEANRTNPSLPRFMKWGQVSADDVRKHGARKFNVVPNLAELAAATAKRA
jgi:hypothetical protein